MADTPMDAEKRIKSLIDLTESLNAIFVQENEFLEGARPQDLAPLQPEKARLAAGYAQAIREVAADRTAVEDVDQNLLTELRKVTKNFEKNAERQNALLAETPVKKSA